MTAHDLADNVASVLLLFWKSILTKTIEKSNVSILNKHFYKFTPPSITGYALNVGENAYEKWPET